MAGHKREIIGPTRRGSIIGAVEGGRRVVASMQSVASLDGTPSVFVGSKTAPVREERILPLRVDSVESYDEFITERAAASPSLPELAQSVVDLRALLLAHLSDGHGGQAVIDIAGDVSRLRDSVLLGARVPARFPPEAQANTRCWRDGDVLCCSIRVKGSDGRPRVLTTCSPVADHIDDVLGYAVSAGVDPLAGLDYLPTVALMEGSGRLAKRLAKAAQDDRTRSCWTPCVAEVSPDGRVSWGA